MAEVLLFPPAAPAPDHAIPDSAARRAALDTTRSFLVEAPAGSGKTGLLIQRFLKLLAGDDITDPTQVLAITFTRKATGEMRERVLAHLNAAAASAPTQHPFDAATRVLAADVLARDTTLGWGLLEQPARLNIRTIDSVCVDIARALPVLSSAAGAQAPTDDAKPLHAEAARRTLMLLGGDDAALSHAIEQMLLHRDGSLPELEGLIANMLATREQWLGLLPAGAVDDETLDREVLPRMEQLLDQIICRSLTHVAMLMPAHLQQRFAELAARLAHNPPYKDEPVSPIAICRELTTAPGQAAADLDHWIALAHLATTRGGTWRAPGGLTINHLKFAIDKTAKLELADIIAEGSEIPGLLEALNDVANLPPPRYPPEQWRVARHLIRILVQALAELQQVFASRAQCDFNEVGLLARRALRGDPDGHDLAVATGLSLRHLLVDEMQDTSTGQYELIELLTRSWRDGQTVFLVGDPKQSIYRFRQARVERFLATMRSGRIGGGVARVEILRLTANFRSRPGLVEHFNDDFARIFTDGGAANPSHPEAVAYQLAHAVRPPGTTRARQWHATRIPCPVDASQRPLIRQAQAQLDAGKIARIIADWRGRPLPAGRTEPWTIAILARGRAHFPPVVAALKQAGIAFRAVDIDPLAERQEILDLLALTRALLHPADRTAWLALLRTPWCGLTLADLHTVAGGDDTTSSERTMLAMLEARGEDLSSDGIERLTPFWSVMTGALAQRGQLPLSAWVAGTWRAFGSPAYATPEELSNIERYFALLDDISAETGAALGDIDLPTLERRLKDLYAFPSSDADALDLMTIHGAKGLEWDVVLVPALERTTGATGGRLLDWLEVEADGEESAGIFAPIKSKGGPGQKLNQWIRSVEAARETAERKRLFYVVATRAREELHLFAAPVESKDGSLNATAGTLLQAAWPAAEEVFNTIAPGQLIAMPAPLVIDTLAATQGPPATRIIHRLAVPQLPPIPLAVAAKTGPVRPEGSFAARIFGNAVHAFLEQLTHRLTAGIPPRALVAELAIWSPRVAAVLRAGGLGPADLDRMTTQVITGLGNTLGNPEGLWLLQPHPGAESESALQTADERLSLRLDRTFLGGAIPLAQGKTHRWIVDFKTSSHSLQGLEAWLEAQRQTYAPQLERYAAAFPDTTPIRLALFYPMLPRLLWWSPPETTTNADSFRE